MVQDDKIHVRVNSELKEKAAKVFSDYGLSDFSEGINLFLAYVAERKQLPFPLPSRDKSLEELNKEERKNYLYYQTSLENLTERIWQLFGRIWKQEKRPDISQEQKLKLSDLDQRVTDLREQLLKVPSNSYNALLGVQQLMDEYKNLETELQQLEKE